MKYIFFLFIFIITLLSCTDNGVNPKKDPLNAVLMVSRSPDWAVEEKGIGAVPDGDYIFIQWHLAEESAYFKSYRLERTSDYNQNDLQPINFQVIALPAYFDTSYTDTTNIILNTTYYYRVSVVNVDDKLSNYSDTVFFQLGPKPIISTGLEQTDTTLDVIFSIDLNNTSIPEPVYLRLFRGTDKILISLLNQEPFYNSPSITGQADFKFSELTDYETGKKTTIRTDITENDKIKLVQNAIYQVRVDYKGPLNRTDANGHSGAKSQWQSFRYKFVN